MDLSVAESDPADSAHVDVLHRRASEVSVKTLSVKKHSVQKHSVTTTSSAEPHRDSDTPLRRKSLKKMHLRNTPHRRRPQLIRHGKDMLQEEDTV